MISRAYYNDNDPDAAAWLRRSIIDGIIAPGDVDDRSIHDVRASDLSGYTQHHFFAGIGGWPKRKSGGIDLQSTAQLSAWPTPMVGTPGAGNNDSSRKMMEALTPWPTPNAMEGGATSRGGDRKSELLMGGLVKGWNTPRATDGDKGSAGQTGGSLPADAALAAWSTPTRQDAANHAGPSQWMRKSWALNVQASACGATSNLPSAAMVKHGALNPDLPRWLMGFPKKLDASSRGFASWVLIQELLAGLSPSQSTIESAVSEATAMQ
ncbi:MAG TPA: hypothetical protein VHQ47_17855 [Phycisphaerae bacterium]|jgi:hypothetical protein|nr:hypothetical protein [Phycisphaerae bacterium]